MSTALLPLEPGANRDKFTGKAEAYALYRERYDADAVLPILREWCGLTSQWRVADIGAGTGMLGDIFRMNGNSVIAIEPNTEMRQLCEQLHAADEDFQVLDGTAEATTLPAESVDLIAAGRAWHWFSPDAAMQEFRRILRPGGWVVIIASGREEKGRPENEAVEKLLLTDSQYLGNTRASYSVYERLSEFFADGVVHHAESAGEMHLEWNDFRGLVLSYSHAPLPGSAAFPGFERELEMVFQTFQSGGKLTLATRTWINAGRFE